MTEQLAIIHDIHIGMRDVSYPVIFFDADTKLNGAALQCIQLTDPRANTLLESVYKLEDLVGKPCIVSCDDNLIKFVRLA